MNDERFVPCDGDGDGGEGEGEGEGEEEKLERTKSFRVKKVVQGKERMRESLWWPTIRIC